MSLFKVFPLIAALICWFPSALPLRCQDLPALSGPWLFHYVRAGEEINPERRILDQTDERVTGSLNDLSLKGTLHGKEIELVLTQPDGVVFGRFHGTTSRDLITGELLRGTERTGATLRRLARLDGVPQRHVFMPVSYPRVFDGKIPAVLHLHSGDTLRTTTIDAAGYDQRNAVQSIGGNPQTGPFYVDGAAPGDTLAITINKLQLNRNSALSDGRLAPTSVTPFYFSEARIADDLGEHWLIDLEGGVARLRTPSERLKSFTVPVRPMLGCIATAPPDAEAYRANWLGPWGGNMDYNRLREGATVYLPIFQEGALLFFGDAHALQGDGEINGNALETSMDVEITVKVTPGHQSAGPRAEDGDSLMAMGIAGSFPEALKAATSELARWLQEDYKLNSNEVAVVLGTSVHYDIAEVVDPQVNIVARISKKTLAQLGR